MIVHVIIALAAQAGAGYCTWRACSWDGAGAWEKGHARTMRNRFLVGAVMLSAAALAAGFSA